MKRSFQGYLLGSGTAGGTDTQKTEKNIVKVRLGPPCCPISVVYTRCPEQHHAYSIFRLEEFSDKHGHHQLVQLRNPKYDSEYVCAAGVHA